MRELITELNKYKIKMTKQDEKILMLEVDIDVLTIKLERQERLSKHLKEQLALCGVSNQRELLNAFVDKYNDRVYGDKRICNDEVDIYLDSI